MNINYINKNLNPKDDTRSWTSSNTNKICILQITTLKTQNNACLEVNNNREKHTGPIPGESGRTINT